MKLVSAAEVERVLCGYLKSSSYKLLHSGRKPGETGADIIAEKGRQRLFVEVIGFQSAPPIRSREFYECFFRAISRGGDRSGARLVMALPARFSAGMASRKRQYGVAWEKIGRAFPNLEIWYVNTQKGVISQCFWNSCDGEGTHAQAESGDALRGKVIRLWKSGAKPKWGVRETVDACRLVDERMEKEGRNPAPKFRAACHRGDRPYLRLWVQGCQFPWLKT